MGEELFKQKIEELEKVKKKKQRHNENDVLFSSDTGKLGKKKSECSHQESSLWPSDY